MAARPRVVIVGAGFGGLACARKLAGTPVDVLVLDRNNYHLFTPLLYQVASSLLNPGDIARPIRSILKPARNIRFRQANVTKVDYTRKEVRTEEGATIPYDYLVIAIGSTTNFFGLEQAEARAFGLKDLPEALELRNHVLHCLETATLDADDRAAWLTFVVIGGGPTGVEYAGALSELLRLTVPGDYPELSDVPIRVALVEGRPEVLPPFPEELGRAAHEELTKRGVDVLSGATVVAYDGDRVSLSTGVVIETRTVVWAAGVKPATIDDGGGPRSASGRIVVDAYLRVAGADDVFAIGDVASVTLDSAREVPMLSAAAMQEGRAVAANVLAAIQGGAARRFHYRDRGSMATIGKNAAVAAIGPLRLRGFVGWIAWLTVHLYYLIGFRNRLTVLLSWAWNYLRADRPVRIITRARGR